MKRSYDLLLKQANAHSFLVQPMPGPDYRPEFWLSGKKGSLIATRFDRVGQVHRARIGTFEIEEGYAQMQGLSDADYHKEASIHEFTTQK